jgi:hypothetical protein
MLRELFMLALCIFALAGGAILARICVAQDHAGLALVVMLLTTALIGILFPLRGRR